jgi:hypothetical protein
MKMLGVTFYLIYIGKINETYERIVIRVIKCIKQQKTRRFIIKEQEEKR